MNPNRIFHNSLSRAQRLVGPWAMGLLLCLSAATVFAQVPESGQLEFTAPDYYAGEKENTVTTARWDRSIPGARLTVTRAGGARGAVQVDFVVTNGTAMLGTHFDLPFPLSGTLLFRDYEMSRDIIVPIIDDATNNDNRTFGIILRNPRAAEPGVPDPVLGAITRANVTIRDDDTGFNFGRVVYRAAESTIQPGSSGQDSQVTVTVNMPDMRQDDVSVRYEIVGGNQFPLQAGSDYATPGDDFVVMSGTLTFAPNISSQSFTIPIVNDNLVEFSEDFQIRLSDPDGEVMIDTNTVDAAVGAVSAISVTIVFDDLFGVWYRTNAPGSGFSNYVATLGSEQPAGAVDVKYNPALVEWSRPPLNPTPGANYSIYALAMQPDGLAVIGGDFTAVNTEPLTRLARLDTNGWIDASFSIGTGVDGPVEAIAIYTSGIHTGKIAIAGTFTSVNGTQRQGVARLNANGTLDTSFNPGSGANGPVRALAIQDDGKIVIGGEFTAVSENTRFGVARLNADGSVDSTFDPGFGADGAVWAVALVGTNNPQVVIGGEFFNVDLVPRSGIARLNADGSLDTGFDPGSGTDGIVFAAAVEPNGKIIIGGSFSQLDLQSRNNIARLNTDGSLDSTFDPGQGADNGVFCITPQADGTILIGGAFKEYDYVRRLGIARLLNHGPLDTSFLDTAYNQFAGVIDPQGFVNGIGVQPYDGAVIVAGTFAQVGGGFSRTDRKIRFNIARLVGNSTPGPGNLELVTGNYRVDENATFLFAALTRTNGMLGPVQVGGSTRDGLALAGEDYLNALTDAIWGSYWPNGSAGQHGWMVSDGVTNSLVFAPTIVIPIFDDISIEGNETFYLDLAPPFSTLRLGGEVIPLGVALGRYTATVTIADNDFSAGAFSFSTPIFSVNENGTNAIITVVRTGGSVGAASVDYATLNGTNNPALAGVDYSTRTSTLRFASGDIEGTIVVPILDDTGVELDETFFVRLSNPRGGAGLSSQTNAVVTIIDNDYAPGRLAFAAPTFTANEYGSFLTATIRRTGGNAGAVSVRAVAANGSASSPADFNATNLVLNWADGDSDDKTFRVAINDDGAVEGNETIALSLTNFVSALPGTQTNALATIIDDDFYGTLAFSSPTYIGDEIGGAAIITVVRSGGVAGTVGVNFGTANLPPGPGSATNGVGGDYFSTNGTLTFLPGQLSATFTVRVSDDALTEGDEALRLTLSTVTGGAALGSPAIATLSIVDNESFNIPAGSLDTGFNPSAGANDTINALALQPNGALIVAGDFTLVNNVTRNGVARLLGDGSLDGSFDPGAGLNGSARTVALQSDGRVVVGGLFTTVNGTNRNRIARLNSDGSVDVSFNPGAGADNPVHSLAVTTVGGARKVLVGGGFSSFNGIGRNSITRLNENGSVDASFDPGSGANGAVYAVAVQTDGKVLVGGDFTVFNGSIYNSIVRLNPDGSIDPTFNIGVGANGSVRALAIQTDGKIVVGGLFTSFGGGSFGRLTRLNQDGSVDGSFNGGAGADGAVLAILTQLDGKLILAGEFTTFDGISRRRITRLNSDGSVDPSINFGSGANNFISSLALQPDRKIIIAGGFTSFNEQPRNYLARLHGGSLAGSGSLEFAAPVFTANENGTNAQVVVRRTGGTFSTVTINYAVIGGTATPGSDYTLTPGTLTFPQGETRQVISVPLINDAFIESDETVQLELSSPTGGAVLGNQPTAALTIVSDDAVIRFTSPSFTVIENFVNSNATISVTRTGAVSGTVTVNYSSTPGTASAGLDFTPTSGSLVFTPGETVKTFSVPIVDDALVEGNETVNLSLFNLVGPAVLGSPAAAVLTINENDFSPGTFSFGATSYRVGESNTSVTLTVIRTNGSSGTVSVRYSTADGTATPGQDYTGINTTVAFGDGETVRPITIPLAPDTLVEGNETFDVILSDPTGGAILGGQTRVAVTIDDDDFGPGSLDPTFDPGSGANGLVRALVVQPNGRIVIGGAFTRFNNVDRNFVGRLHVNGAVDFSFAPGAGPNGIVSAVGVDTADGDVLVGGSFSVVNGANRARLARLTSGGAVDASQDQPTGLDAAVYAMALQGDSKVIAGGAFQLPKSSLARVRVNGSVDTSFDTGVGADGPIFAVVRRSNGDVFAGGSFETFDGIARSRIVKLLTDGSLDLGFNSPAVTGGSVFAVAIQPDGKVIIAGEFTEVDGEPRGRVARLNVDGSLDTGFNPGTGASGAVYAAGIQSDGKILLAGAFTSFSGLTRNRIARLDSTGALDTSFEPGLGANNTVYTLALLADGKILIGGDFTSVNGFMRSGVARLNGDAPSNLVRIQQGFGFSANDFRLTVNAQAGRSYALDFSSDLINWTTLTIATAAGPVLEFIDNAPAPGHRFYRVRDLNP